MKTYQLKCIAPDGDFVTEGRDFPSIGSAWDRSSDMGSRWYFYPIHIVTGKRRILDVPHGMPKAWIGRNLNTLRSAIAADPEHACDYANGKCPFLIYP